MIRKRKQAKSTFITDGIADIRLVVFTAITIIFGLIMVYDASVVFANNKYGDQFRFVKLHLLWLALGAIAMFIAYYVDYHYLSKIITPIVFITILLLLGLLLFGEENNGSKRWFEISAINFRFQPSELAKISFVIYLASWLSKERKVSTKGIREAIKYHLTSDLGSFLFLLGFVCTLIILEPDLGTAAIIAFTSLIVYFVSNSGYLHNIGSIFIILLFVIMGGVASIISPYRLERVNTFKNFLITGEFENELGEDYQLKQALTAVGSGGITGLGFGQSKQKFFYLVDITPFTDSIFAVISEELGFIGSTSVVLTFLAFGYIGYNISSRAPDKFGFLLGVGITSWIVIQAFLHMAANSAVLPVTGTTLPLISYGGSSTFITMSAIGILLNISRQMDRNISNPRSNIK